MTGKISPTRPTLQLRQTNVLYSELLWINVLRLGWIVAVIWSEAGVFYWALRDCRWPVVANLREASEPTSRVLLLTDTQVYHHLLHSKVESWGMGLRRYLTDLYLKKSWHVTSRLKPDVVVFLGDMLAEGKLATDRGKYTEAVKKFKSIFHVHPTTAMHYVTGNNDVWLGEVTASAKNVRGFFAEAFGPTSTTFDVQGHTFVALDAPGIVDEDYRRSGTGIPFSKWNPVRDGPVAFVNDIAEKRHRNGDGKPLILLSHIPLSRPEMANCGPYRERGTIRRNVGHGFQSMLGRQTTTFILQTLQPLAVFSGDNRDYCEYNHTIAGDIHTIREVTLKSFSPSVHISNPGFQLLSVASPASVEGLEDSTIADRPCFLPNQGVTYRALYTPLLFFTLIVLGVLALRRWRAKGRYTALRPSPLQSTFNSGRSPRGSPIVTPSSGRFPSTHRLTQARGSPRSVAAPIPRSPRVPESPFGRAVEDIEEDPMQPAQYAVFKDEPKTYEDHDEEWSHVGRSGSPSGDGRDLEGGLPSDYDFVNSDSLQTLDSSATFHPSPLTSPKLPQAQFVPAPEALTRRTKKGGWSWSFVLGGRVRRVTVRAPSWAAVHNLVGLLTGMESRRRGGVWRATGMDAVSMLWPPFLLWFILAHVMY